MQALMSFFGPMLNFEELDAMAQIEPDRVYFVQLFVKIVDSVPNGCLIPCDVAKYLFTYFGAFVISDRNGIAFKIWLADQKVASDLVQYILVHLPPEKATDLSLLSV